ncbi:hypothetical protein PG996_005841 [Apiospora saccharicola]|uniref:Uncharacterized protein n=1 Tax=Apiospora saccharicola TaxID=335842 RepID=A0ABR1VMK9_9PEZI
MAKAFKFGDDLWDPSHRFETSWLVSPYVLFGCRAIISLYTFTTLFVVLGWNCTHPGPDSEYTCQASAATFSYFTHLTYWGLAFYFLVSSIHTFTYARWHVALLDKWPRPLQALHAFYYSTITCYPFLVTIVYWGLIYGALPGWFPTAFGAWSNIAMHGMNSLFALFEIIVPRTSPSPLIHMFWLIVVLVLYLALAYVTKATKGFYTYDFLDPAKQKNGLVAAYVFGIAVAILIVFMLVWGLLWTRRWLTEQKLGIEGKFAKGGRPMATTHVSTWEDNREDQHEMHSTTNFAKRNSGRFS